MSISTVRQSAATESSARLTVTTHEARTADAKSAIEKIKAADYVKDVLQVMRVEGN